MRFEKFSFGSIRIDGTAYERDVVIDRGEGPQAQKEAVQKVPRRLRPYAGLYKERIPGSAAAS
jgi:hypothetical protein